MAIKYNYTPRMERIRRREQRAKQVKLLSNILWIIVLVGAIVILGLYGGNWHGTI